MVLTFERRDSKEGSQNLCCLGKCKMCLGGLESKQPFSGTSMTMTMCFSSSKGKTMDV